MCEKVYGEILLRYIFKYANERAFRLHPSVEEMREKYPHYNIDDMLDSLVAYRWLAREPHPQGGRRFKLTNKARAALDGY